MYYLNFLISLYNSLYNLLSSLFLSTFSTYLKNRGNMELYQYLLMNNYTLFFTVYIIGLITLMYFIFIYIINYIFHISISLSCIIKCNAPKDYTINGVEKIKGIRNAVIIII